MKDAFVFEAQPFGIAHEINDEYRRRRCNCHNRSEVQAGESELYQPYQSDVQDRFGGPEHRLIGDLGAAKLPTTIVYDEKGTTLTVGEMIALAGDLFDDYFQMKELARTAAGRGQLRWALWKALDGKGPEPNVPEATKDKVKEEYLALAGRNISHYLTGGTSWATYFKWHSKAMVHALDAGIDSDEKVWREAISKEAFALHFLTDSFSSGHIRTPRAEMEAWYAAKYGNAVNKFVDKFASLMYGELKKRNRELRYPGKIPFLGLLPKYFTERTIKRDMKQEMKKFSLDDPIALALHDIDNEKGLHVISSVDPNGRPVKGGYKWIAFGDGKLGELSPDSKRPETQNMVVSAVRASLNELKLIRIAGGQNKRRQLTQSQRLAIMKKALGITELWNKVAAGKFLPKEDKSGNNSPLPEWRWGKIDQLVYDRVDKEVKTTFAQAFFDKAAAERKKGPKTALGVIKIGGTADGLFAFAKTLQTKGIRFFEEFLGNAR